MTPRKITTLLFVDRIEPALAFWESQAGYQAVAKVPHGDALGFVILAGAAGELMLQTRDSLSADLPAIAARAPAVALYADVASLDEALASLRDAEILVPERTTFYGAREVWIADPAGTVIGLAEPSGG